MNCKNKLRDGGEVGGKGRGDKIPAMYEPGEFVVSNAMLKNAPGLREHLHSLRNATLHAQGKSGKNPVKKGRVHGMTAIDPLDPTSRVNGPPAALTGEAAASDLLRQKTNEAAALRLSNASQPTTSLGAAPTSASNSIEFKMPPEPIVAETSLGAADPNATRPKGVKAPKALRATLAPGPVVTPAPAVAPPAAPGPAVAPPAAAAPVASDLPRGMVDEKPTAAQNAAYDKAMAKAEPFKPTALRETPKDAGWMKRVLVDPLANGATRVMNAGGQAGQFVKDAAGATVRAIEPAMPVVRPVLRGAGTLAGPALTAYDVNEVDNKGGTSSDMWTQGLETGSKVLAGAAGGAILGAPAAGIGAIPGAIAGGLAGYYGADAAIGGLRLLSGQDPRSPLDRLNGVKRTDVLAGIEDGTHRLAGTQPIPSVPNITKLVDAAEASARFDKTMIARNEAARPQWDADTAAHNKEYAKFTHITAPGGRSIALAKDTPQNSPAAPSAAPEVAAPARGLRNSAGVLQQQGPTRAELGQILSRGGTGNKEMDSMIAMQLLGMNSDNKSDVLRSMSNTESAGVQRYGHETHLAAAKLPFDVAEKQREKLAEYYRELDAQPGEPGKPKPTVSVGGLLRRGIDPTSFQSAQRFNSEMQTAELGQQKTRADLNRDAYKGTALAYDAEGNRVVNPAGDDAAASRAHAVSGGRAIYGDPSANAGLVPLHQANSRATDIARANQNQGLFRTIGVYPNTPPVAPLNDKTLRGSRFEDVPFWTTDRFTRGTNWGDPRLIPDDGTEPMNLRRLGQDDLDQLRMRKKWLADQDAAEAAAKKGTTK